MYFRQLSVGDCLLRLEQLLAKICNHSRQRLTWLIFGFFVVASFADLEAVEATEAKIPPAKDVSMMEYFRFFIDQSVISCFLT